MCYKSRGREAGLMIHQKIPKTSGLEDYIRNNGTERAMKGNLMNVTTNRENVRHNWHARNWTMYLNTVPGRINTAGENDV